MPWKSVKYLETGEKLSGSWEKELLLRLSSNIYQKLSDKDSEMNWALLETEHNFLYGLLHPIEILMLDLKPAPKDTVSSFFTDVIKPTV